MSRRKIQYTVRDIPSVVNEALRLKARRLGKSLNAVTRDALISDAGLGSEIRLYHDLDSFFGSWIEDPEVDKALAEQHRIDKGLWK